MYQQGGGKKRKKQHECQSGNKHDSSVPKITFIDNDKYLNDDYDGKRGKSDDHHSCQDRQAMVSFGGISLRINEFHLNKLKHLYERTLLAIFPNDFHGYCRVIKDYHHYFPQMLFTTLLRYDALEGAGLQSSIPPTVFRLLHKRYGCTWECFASPFNCWFENKTMRGSLVGSEKSPMLAEGRRYGSAFGDTDAFFGGAGSFFGWDFLAMANELGGGCFQANPPFASDFIENMCQRMHFLLSTSNENVVILERKDDLAKLDRDTKIQYENKVIPIMFIIFVPAWKESSGWKTLVSSPYLTKHVLLSQKDDVHYYAEGTQHRRRTDNRGVGTRAMDDKSGYAGVHEIARKTRRVGKGGGTHRIASFDTSVFFLQNDAAKEKWPLSDDDEGRLKAAFAMIPEYEDEAREETFDQHLQWQEQHLTFALQKKEAKSILKQSQRKEKYKKPAPKERAVKMKKPKLVSGSKDELNILASLGIMDYSSSQNNEDTTRSKHGKQIFHYNSPSAMSDDGDTEVENPIKSAVNALNTIGCPKSEKKRHETR